MLPVLHHGALSAGKSDSLSCTGLHLPDSSALFATNTSLMEVRNKTPRVDHLERRVTQSSE